MPLRFSASIRPARLMVTAFPLLILACSHSDSFAPHSNGTTQPLAGGLPTRLTYNSAQDVTPSWLPDGSGVAYAFGMLDPQHDQCIGVLPPTGGRRTREICNNSTFSTDSTDTFSWPVVSAGGQLAYERSSRPLASAVDRNERLGIAAFATPDVFTPLVSFPSQLGSAFYVAPAFSGWLTESRLVFIGLVDTSVPTPPCTGPSCQLMTVRSGHDVLIADIAGGAAQLTVVPGTTWATSVSAGEAADVIYYTLADSTGIFRQMLSSGAITKAHDFGPLGIARDVSAASGELVAVVGGLVQLLPDGVTTNPIQQDFGGRLIVVDASGAEHELAAPLTLFRHPALSPDGATVIAEAYPIVVSHFGAQTDTTVTGGPDLVSFPAR